MKNNDNDNTPDTGLSPLSMAAMQMHEMYTELRKAGFNRTEALYLIARMATGNPDDNG